MKNLLKFAAVAAIITWLASDGLAQNQRGNQGQRQGTGQPNPAALFGQYDRNNDGVISAQEIPAEGRQRLAQLDANGDGGCDRSEFQAGLQLQYRNRGQAQGQQRGGADMVLARFDQNGDGVLSADEVPANAMRQFAQMDADGDGGCDRSELEAGMQQQGQGQGQGQGQRGQGQQSGQGQQHRHRHQSGQGQRGGRQSGGRQSQRSGGGGGGQRGGGGSRGQRGGGGR